VLAALGAACAKPDRTLIDAIERKDVAAVQAILDKSPARAKEPLKEWRKTAKSSRGSGTAWQKEAIDLPLLAAARAGSVEIATLLLDKGADANGALAGKTPLQVALASGPPEMVKLLVARGARLDGRDEEGWTALHYAARSDPADVQALLDLGADVNAGGTRHGETPLHVAAESGEVKTAPWAMPTPTGRAWPPTPSAPRASCRALATVATAGGAPAWATCCSRARASPGTWHGGRPSTPTPARPATRRPAP
jgi:hypothetical protein